MYVAIIKSLKDGAYGKDLSGEIVPMPINSTHMVSRNELGYYKDHADSFQIVNEGNLGPAVFSGGVLIDPANGSPLISPVISYTWATRPAAASNTGVVIRITDIGGSVGSRWISDGAYWKPESGRVVLGAGANGYADPHDIVENILASVVVPAGSMGVTGILSVMQSWSMTNSVNVKTMGIRLGGIGGVSVYSSTQTTIASIRTWVELQNRNSSAIQVSSTGSANGLLAGGIGGALLTSTIDTSLEKVLVFTATKNAASAAASENLTLERYIVELITP